MARELKTAGFEVLLHRDLTYRGMVKAVETLANSITGGDQVVVFFAGHGVQIKSGSYLLPVDIEATSESEVEKTAYGLNDLTERLSDTKAAFTLVIVDACRDNPLKSKGRNVGSSRGLSAIEPPKGQMVVYSASRGQQALDRLSDRDSNPNGVFTREFIAKMKRPGVRIEDLVREVQDSVEALARTVSHEQRPAIYNEARGNFYFLGPNTVQVQGQGTAIPEMTIAQREDTFWADAQTAENREAFEAYLNSYPNGRYANLARANMARLLSTTTPPTPAQIAVVPLSASASATSSFQGSSNFNFSPTKWDLPTAYAAANFHTENVQQFANDVDKATGGKLKIQVHAGASLFKAPEIKRAVQGGQAQAGEILLVNFENENALFGLDGIPFLATSYGDAMKLYKASKPALEKALAAQGIKLLFTVPWPPQGIFTNKQLNSAADMKGLKWRAYSPATAKLAELVGAQPVTIQVAELSQAMATGVINSYMSSGATGFDTKTYKHIKNWYDTQA